jgi:hypothetical protein
LPRCITVEESVNAAAEQIAAVLPVVLEDTPDQIILNSQGHIRMNWYDYAWFLGSGVHAVLDMAILMIIFTATSLGLIGAYPGGDNLRGRLKWLSASLFTPRILFLVMGLTLVSTWMVGTIVRSLASNRWDGAQFTDAYREAVTNLLVPAIQQIGSGFLLTGVVACLIALALLFWSLATPARGQQNPKMVQVQVQNP